CLKCLVAAAMCFSLDVLQRALNSSKCGKHLLCRAGMCLSGGRLLGIVEVKVANPFEVRECWSCSQRIPKQRVLIALPPTHFISLLAVLDRLFLLLPKQLNAFPRPGCFGFRLRIRIGMHEGEEIAF